MSDSEKSEKIKNFLMSAMGDPSHGCQRLPEYLDRCLEAWPTWWGKAKGGMARIEGKIDALGQQLATRESLKCFLVLVGMNQLELEEGNLRVRAGEMGVIAESWAHKEQWVRDGNGHYLHLFIAVLPGRLAVNMAGAGGGFGLRDGDHAIYQGASIPFSNSGMLASLLEFQAIHQLGDAAWGKVIREVLLRGLRERAGESGSLLIRSCKAIITSTATNPELSVKALADRLGCHPDYLSRRFIEETGSGLMETVRTMRLQVAKDLLEGSWLTVAEVAALSGWKDHSYFSLVFRKRFGCSPMEHRQLHRRSRSVSIVNGP